MIEHIEQYFLASLEHLGSFLMYMQGATIIGTLFFFFSSFVLAKIFIDDIKYRKIPHLWMWGLIYGTFILLIFVSHSVYINITIFDFIYTFFLLILIHLFSRDIIVKIFEKRKKRVLSKKEVSILDYGIITAIVIFTFISIIFTQNILSDFVGMTFVFFIFITILLKGNFGIGDIELFVFLSLIIGIFSIPALFLASIISLPYILYKSISKQNVKIKKKKEVKENYMEYVPFGPFIIISYYVIVLTTLYIVIIPVLNK